MKAYDRVLRSLLSTVCQERLQTEHLQMAAILLQPLSVGTRKQITNSCSTITIGVPQGEPFSCALFNIFHATLLEKLSRVPHHISENAASALADDVILMSKTAESLQLLLDNCTEWSADFQMVWNSAPGKSEVLLSPRRHQTSTFFLFLFLNRSILVIVSLMSKAGKRSNTISTSFCINIFQNTVLEKLIRVPHYISDKGASALADDVNRLVLRYVVFHKY